MVAESASRSIDIQAATELCLRFEGVVLKPYLCPAGVWTIGVGATFYEDGKSVTANDPPITRNRAIGLLDWHLRSVFLPGVLRLCPGLLPQSLLENNWGRLNAVLDFAFNTGVGRLQTSTLRRKINEQDWEGAKEQLALWVRGGGRVLPGLVKRAQARIQLMG